MSFRSIHAPTRVSGALLALALVLASAACGGGTDQNPTEVSSAFPAAQRLSASAAHEAGMPEFDTNCRKYLIRIGQPFGIATTGASAGSRWWVS